MTEKLIFPGYKAFKLYATYGLPIDIIELELKEAGIALDREGFDRCMREHREKAKGSFESK